MCYCQLADKKIAPFCSTQVAFIVQQFLLFLNFFSFFYLRVPVSSMVLPLWQHGHDSWIDVFQPSSCDLWVLLYLTEDSLCASGVILAQCPLLRRVVTLLNYYITYRQVVKLDWRKRKHLRWNCILFRRMLISYSWVHLQTSLFGGARFTLADPSHEQSAWNL